MEKSFQIVDLDTDSTRIRISVTAKDDGSLRIDDWSMGEVADSMFGEDSDVESWITISPEATRELSVKLFRDWNDDPAAAIGKYLATRYFGDTRAVSRIKELLSSLDLQFEWEIW